MASGSCSSSSAGASPLVVGDKIVLFSPNKQKLRETAVKEYKYVSLNELISKSKSSASGTAAEVQESSESDGGGGETERRSSRRRKIFPPQYFTRTITNPESIQFRLLIEKRLWSKNLDEWKNQMPIPVKTMKEAFLMPEEEKVLNSGKVMEVPTIEPDGETKSSLTLLLQKRRPTYVLAGAWSYMVARHPHVLKKGRLLRIWWFRVDGSLQFALEVVDERIDGGEIIMEMSHQWHYQNLLHS